MLYGKVLQKCSQVQQKSNEKPRTENTTCSAF